MAWRFLPRGCLFILANVGRGVFLDPVVFLQ